MIKAITFDLDGVYFPDGKQKFIAKLVALGIDELEVKRVFLESPEMNSQYKLGTMNDEQYWSWVATQWSVDKSPEQLIQVLLDCYSVDSEVESLVKTVRNKGYKTLICSNNFPARIHGLQAKFGFLDNFDTAVFSYEVGFSKPSTEIFTELVQRSGVAASNIAYADDDARKITGALDLGINAFVYKNSDQFVEQLQVLGVDV